MRRDFDHGVVAIVIELLQLQARELRLLPKYE
jgi:hypothetical protein